LKHEARHKLFGLEIDADFKREVETVLHNARATLSENLIAVAVFECTPKTLTAAKDTINGQIMQWEAVRLGVDDVQPRLWELAQAVCSGKILAD